MKYYVAETDARGYVLDPAMWTPTKARTIQNDTN